MDRYKRSDGEKAMKRLLKSDRNGEAETERGK